MNFVHRKGVVSPEFFFFILFNLQHNCLTHMHGKKNRQSDWTEFYLLPQWWSQHNYL